MAELHCAPVACAHTHMPTLTSTRTTALVLLRKSERAGTSRSPRLAVRPLAQAEAHLPQRLNWLRHGKLRLAAPPLQPSGTGYPEACLRVACIGDYTDTHTHHKGIPSGGTCS